MIEFNACDVPRVRTDGVVTDRVVRGLKLIELVCTLSDKKEKTKQDKKKG